MQTSVTSRDGSIVIVLQGRFDFNSHREFRDALDQAIKEPAAEIRVDLTAVDYLDSSALGMLLVLRDKGRESGKTVVLANARGTVKQVIDIANFGKLFTVA
jgi:anti-anti-sigma factor